MLCYGTHPFADASALQIGQAKWTLPAGGAKRPASYRASAAEIELLHLLLQRDPRCRPTATALRTGVALRPLPRTLKLLTLTLTLKLARTLSPPNPDPDANPEPVPTSSPTPDPRRGAAARGAGRR